MGENKRYAEHYGRLMNERIGEWVMRAEPMLLTAAELQLRQNPPKDFDQPRRVYAWVRCPTLVVHMQAQAIAWTSTAVKIRFREPHIDAPREGWVRCNAVTPALAHAQQPTARRRCSHGRRGSARPMEANYEPSIGPISSPSPRISFRLWLVIVGPMIAGPYCSERLTPVTLS